MFIVLLIKHLRIAVGGLESEGALAEAEAQGCAAVAALGPPLASASARRRQRRHLWPRVGLGADDPLVDERLVAEGAASGVEQETNWV